MDSVFGYNGFIEHMLEDLKSPEDTICRLACLMNLSNRNMMFKTHLKENFSFINVLDSIIKSFDFSYDKLRKPAAQYFSNKEFVSNFKHQDSVEEIIMNANL